MELELLSGPVDLTDPYRIAASKEALRYAWAPAATKRRNPGDDLATMFVRAEIDGNRLTDTELMWFFLLLINAGGEGIADRRPGCVLLRVHPSPRR
jgi:cytochrome P450